MKKYISLVIGTVVTIISALLSFGALRALAAQGQSTSQDPTAMNAVDLVSQGRNIFRFDTFGDEAFWGGVLKLHTTIEGAAAGGGWSGA